MTLWMMYYRQLVNYLIAVTRLLVEIESVGCCIGLFVCDV